VTDKNNDVGPAGGADPATVVDFPFPVPMQCAGTPAETGGACAVDTSANALVPGAVTDGQRAIVQVGQIRVDDGGPDGLAATADGNGKFAVQGIFVP